MCTYASFFPPYFSCPFCRFSIFVFLAFSFVFSTLSRKWRRTLFVLELRHLFFRYSVHLVKEIVKLLKKSERWENCLVPRRLSFDEKVRAKEGGKETTGETALRLPSVPFPWSLAVHHQSFVSRSPLPCEKTKRLRRRLMREQVVKSKALRQTKE